MTDARTGVMKGGSEAQERPDNDDEEGNGVDGDDDDGVDGDDDDDDDDDADADDDDADDDEDDDDDDGDDGKIWSWLPFENELLSEFDQQLCTFEARNDFWSL